MDKLNVFTVPVTIGTYREFMMTILENAQLKKNYYTCIANVHTLVEAYFDNDFSTTLKNAHMITPDGRPLTWAIRMFYGIRQERVAGMDLLPDLLKASEAMDIPVYFYGGHSGTPDKTKRHLQQHYPQLRVTGLYSPPFRKLSETEEEKVIQDINDSGAKIVFISLGCPKQEKWMASMANRINGVMIGIGGALNVMIGEQKRAPRWMQSAGLEWSFRLWQEPKRLFKRYALTNSMFIYLFVKAYLYHRFFHPSNNAIDFSHS